MKKPWVTIAIVTSIGLVSLISAATISAVNRIEYEVLSYQVQYLDSNGITLRIMLGITNPLSMDLDVWNQKYDVFVAGSKVSQITSKEKYKILGDNTSTIPLDIQINWQDVQSKIVPIGSQSEITNINNLSVLIKGRLSAKIGVLKLSRIPIRIPGKLGWYLP